MPPKTAVPRAWRLAAPAPVATIMGTTPRMKANEVIRIGRKRRVEALTAASAGVSPASRRILANSTMRMAFLAASPISMTKPIWA